MKTFFASGFLLSCGLFAHAADAREPSWAIARGPATEVAAAIRAGRACGLTDLRLDPLGDRHARLLIGADNSAAAVGCTIGWLKKHQGSLGLNRALFDEAGASPARI